MSDTLDIETSELKKTFVTKAKGGKRKDVWLGFIIVIPLAVILF